MKIVNFTYDHGEKVLILALGMTGRVDAMTYDQAGNMYRVVYWNDGLRNAIWMYDWELESCKREEVKKDGKNTNGS